MTTKKMDLKKAFGPLWPIYNNDEVNEILVDGPNDIYYTQKNVIKDANKLFTDQKQIFGIIKNLTAYAEKKVNKDEYFYTLQLDGSTRVAITLPPMSINGPVFNLLKIPKKNLTFNDLNKFGAVDKKSLALIRGFLKNNQSFLVAGNAGSGRTTLMNCIIDEIPKDHRVVTIEQTPELILNRKRVARLLAPHQKVEELPSLIHAASKMRADWLVHGNLQGPEVMDFVNLVGEGYTAVASLSAENVFDVIRRIEIKMLLNNPGMSMDSIRYSISQAFKYIVFQERLVDGSRKLNCIAGIRYESGEIKLKILYKL